MQETHAPGGATLSVGTTALGRLHLRVPEDDGYEEVMVERRWPDMAAARAWCERLIGRAREGTTVLEIEVFEESWQHPRSWETTKPRPVAEVLQIAVVTTTGEVRWGAPRSLYPEATKPPVG
jgi:hypothetical protein